MKPENLVCFVANLISHTDWTAFSLYSVLVESFREKANPASQFKSPSTRAVFHSEDHLLHVKVMPSLPHIIVSNASAIGRLLWVSVMPFVPVCPEVYYTESGVFIPYLCFLIIIFIALPHSKSNLPHATYSFFLSIPFINGLLWMIVEMAKRIRICTAFVLDPSSVPITHIKYAQQPVVTTSWGSNTSGFQGNLHWCVLHIPTYTEFKIKRV